MKMYKAIIAALFCVAFFGLASTVHAVGCRPTLFRSATGLKAREFQGTLGSPLSGYEIDPLTTKDLYIAYPITEEETSNNLGIHWCWRNTQGVGLGTSACQSGSLSSYYLSPIYYPEDSSGQIYVAARFDQLAADKSNVEWEIAPWAGTDGWGWGTQQCTQQGTTTIKTVTGYSCNSPQASVAYSGKAVHVAVAVDAAKLAPGRTYSVAIKGSGDIDFGNGWGLNLQRVGDKYIGETTFDGGNLPNDTYTFAIHDNSNKFCDNLDMRSCAVFPDCTGSFTVNTEDETRQIDYEDRGQLVSEVDKKIGVYKTPPFDLCRQIPESSPAHQQCVDCRDGAGKFGGVKNGLWTAVGCVSTDGYEGIVRAVLKVGLGIAGGVALLMILASAFMLSTSQGEPKRAGEARDLLTSAVMGLLFIIFSVTILQFIGVELLQIPGFGK